MVFLKVWFLIETPFLSIIFCNTYSDLMAPNFKWVSRTILKVMVKLRSWTVFLSNISILLFIIIHPNGPSFLALLSGVITLPPIPLLVFLLIRPHMENLLQPSFITSWAPLLLKLLTPYYHLAKIWSLIWPVNLPKHNDLWNILLTFIVVLSLTKLVNGCMSNFVHIDNCPSLVLDIRSLGNTTTVLLKLLKPLVLLLIVWPYQILPKSTQYFIALYLNHIVAHFLPHRSFLLCSQMIDCSFSHSPFWIPNVMTMLYPLGV